VKRFAAPNDGTLSAIEPVWPIERVLPEITTPVDGDFPIRRIDDLAATLVTPLPIALELKNGQTLATVGDAVIYFTHLSGTQRAQHYWQTAIQMFNTAVSEPAYLRTATVSLQTALLMDRLLTDTPTSG
jgi:hypothetical protein